jgi:1,4-dihydroxy-2-naphthoyl-CoA synthase
MAQLKDKYEALLLRRQGSRLYLTLNRPEAKNSITPKMIEELNEVFDALKHDHSIKAVIMRGAGGVFRSWSPPSKAMRWLAVLVSPAAPTSPSVPKTPPSP